MKNQDRTTANYAKQFRKKEREPSTWSEDCEDSTKGWYQGTDFAEKNMSQMNAGAYKQNVTTVTKLDIYQSSVRKNHLLKLA